MRENERLIYRKALSFELLRCEFVRQVSRRGKAITGNDPRTDSRGGKQIIEDGLLMEASFSRFSGQNASYNAQTEGWIYNKTRSEASESDDGAQGPD